MGNSTISFVVIKSSGSHSRSVASTAINRGALMKVPLEALELKAPPEALDTEMPQTHKMKSATSGDDDDHKLTYLFDGFYDACYRHG